MIEIDQVSIAGYSILNTLTGKLTSVKGRVIFDDRSGVVNSLRLTSNWLDITISRIMVELDLEYDQAKMLYGICSSSYCYDGTVSRYPHKEFEHHKDICARILPFVQANKDVKFKDQDIFVWVEVSGDLNIKAIK